MSMECRKIFNENIHDIFRSVVIAHSICILREHGRSDDEIKEEMLHDFSVKAEVVDEMLKA